jgi:PAS domain S-box-containing protein
MRLLGADGAYRWFHSRGLPLRNPWGNITRWYNLLIDIDDRKRAEESLRASEHKLRLRLNSIAGLITVHAPSGELELANQPFLDYTGETIEELKDFRHVVHPDDVENALSRWADALVTGNPLSVEARLRRRDGVYRWFNASVLPTRNSEGQIGRWYSLLTDIEDRKSAEAALRAKERELSLILESIPGLVWSASPNGDVIYVNQRISEYLGTSDDKLNQSEWTNFLHAEDAESVLRAWAYSVATGERFEVQCRVRRADGVYRWFHSLSQLGHDNDGRPTRWYGLVVDIDDRESMEESLRRTQDQLSRAAHTAAIGELSAAIAHEINQPLTGVVINGHACLRWLSAQPPNLAEAQWAAERVVRDGRNAGDVVRRVRALFRQSASEKIALDVNEVIGEVLRLLWGEMERRHVVVETQYADGVPYVLGDRVQLQQLILNLLLNGIEAMDSVVDRPKRLLISSKQQNPETVLVEISDCGVGLKDPEKVFESFYTTKPNGMGIGLAICRSIVEGHDGRLWAAAGEDCGATFCFTLPAGSKAEP